MLLNADVLLNEQTKLIQSCIDGNRHSQNQLYEFYAPKMFAVCLRYAKNREEAEEIAQEGFVQVFKSLKSFQRKGSFEGWIRKIMVHCCIRHYRKNIKLHALLNMEPVYINEIGNDDIIAQLGRKELLKMVQSLPPMYRLVFNLYVFEGLKHREIAGQLGISEGTSKSNLFDAKLILQKAVNNSLKIASQSF